MPPRRSRSITPPGRACRRHPACPQSFLVRIVNEDVITFTNPLTTQRTNESYFVRHPSGFVTLLPVARGHIVLHCVTIIICIMLKMDWNFVRTDHMHYHNFYSTKCYPINQQSRHSQSLASHWISFKGCWVYFLRLNSTD